LHELLKRKNIIEHFGGIIRDYLLHDNSSAELLLNKYEIKHINEQEPITKDKIEVYHLQDEYVYKAEKSILVKSLNSLFGVVKGVISDEKVNEYEFQLIEKWVNEYEKFSNSFPYSHIIPKIRTILSDGIISKAEQKYLEEISRIFLKPETFSQSTISCLLIDSLPQISHLYKVISFIPYLLMNLSFYQF
jgi:hypothetical protein